MISHGPALGGLGQQQAAQSQGRGAPTIGDAPSFVVTGCQHPTVGSTVRGTYSYVAENHSRRAYRRHEQVNGLDVMLYYWDDRDGPSFCGWWFGPKIGGDQVWAYHPDKSSQTPPLAGWKVPYDGPVDLTFQLSIAGATQQQQQQQGQPSQWQQLQQQQFQRQQMMQRQQQQMHQQQGSKGVQQWGGKDWGKGGKSDWGKGCPSKGAQVVPPCKGGGPNIEEQRRRLEEANRKRMEDLKRQQEQAAAKRQAELLAKQQEYERQQLEKKATAEIRKVIQKMSLVVPDTAEALKQELSEVQERELPHCYKLQDTIKNECEYALKAAALKVSTILENQRRAEAAKNEERKKRLEKIQLAYERAKELLALLVEGEAVAEDYKAKASPLVDGVDLTLEEIEAVAVVCESLVAKARENTKACSDFVAQKSDELKELPREDDDPTPDDKPMLKDLFARVAALTNLVDVTSRKALEGQRKLARKAQAKMKLNAIQQTLCKYDADRDGVLSKKEFIAYARGEFDFTITVADADAMYQSLLPGGVKGLSIDDPCRIRAIVGIARDKVRNDHKRGERLAKEREVTERRAQIQVVIDEAVVARGEADAAVEALEVAAAELPDKAADARSSETLRLADAMVEQAFVAKSAIERFKALAEKVVSEVPDVKNFAVSENSQLMLSVSKLDARVGKASSSIAKCRDEATRKEARELEDLKLKALKIIRLQQSANQIGMECIFDAFDANRDGRIDEQEFLAFFKKVERSEDDRAAAIDDEDLSRLFGYLDEEGGACLSKLNFSIFVRWYLKVVKETVITTEIGLRGSTTVRRLEVGEVCEVLDGPRKEEETALDRIKIRMLKDGVEGWSTPVGSQGSVFLSEGDVCMKVVKETILTPTFEIGASKETTKKLKVGEFVDIVEWMRKEPSGLTRMRVRTRSDLKVGYATAVGNSGVVFLELA